MPPKLLCHHLSSEQEPAVECEGQNRAVSSGQGDDGDACSPCLTLHLGPLKPFLIAPLWSRPASSYSKHSSYTYRISLLFLLFFFFLLNIHPVPPSIFFFFKEEVLNAFSLKQSFIDLLAGNPEWNLPLSCSKALFKQEVLNNQTLLMSNPNKSVHCCWRSPSGTKLLTVGRVYKTVTHFISQVVCCIELSTIHQK